MLCTAVTSCTTKVSFCSAQKCGDLESFDATIGAENEHPAKELKANIMSKEQKRTPSPKNTHQVFGFALPGTHGAVCSKVLLLTSASTARAVTRRRARASFIAAKLMQEGSGGQVNSLNAAAELQFLQGDHTGQLRERSDIRCPKAQEL
jgi:hypothetical protein